MQGRVKFFNAEKGFGFIIPSGGGDEIFVHATGLVDKIKDNDQVSYEVEKGKKGPVAINVEVL